jgi:hypothetical protein
MPDAEKMAVTYIETVALNFAEAVISRRLKVSHVEGRRSDSQRRCSRRCGTTPGVPQDLVGAGI